MDINLEVDMKKSLCIIFLSITAQFCLAKNEQGFCDIDSSLFKKIDKGTLTKLESCEKGDIIHIKTHGVVSPYDLKAVGRVCKIETIKSFGSKSGNGVVCEFHGSVRVKR